MLQNWFSPSKIIESKDSEVHQASNFGPNLKDYAGFLSDPDIAKIALIGYDGEISTKIRFELYALSNQWTNLPIVDLGNLRNTDPSFCIQAIKAVISHGIIPIVIGAPVALHRIMYEAFQDYEKQMSMALISDRLPLLKQDKSYWSQILSAEVGHLHQFNLLGHQSHFLSADDKSFLDEWALEELRLGDLHAEPANTEPAVRNADLVLMDVNAVRYADAPGQSQPSPNGLFAEEFCQIAKYAGISDKCKAFGIFGTTAAEQAPNITAQLIAQAIWYFIDGALNRKNDFPVSSRHLTEYMVDIKNFDEQISFWKSALTGRWWVQLPTGEKDDKSASAMIPCIYEDYQMASREEISERLFRALKRLG